MSDYGFKVSRAGFDVKVAADYQLLFSSSFPLLSIIQQGTVAQGGFITHGLGYEPIFSFQLFGSQDTEFFDNSITVDTTKLYNGGSDGTIRYYIFNRPIRTSFTAANIITASAVQGSYTQDYGFKVSSPGTDVKTATLAQLDSFSGISAGGQPIRHQQIHQSGFVDNVNNGTTLIVSHNLGYVPLFYVFRRGTGGSQYQMEFLDYIVNADSTVTIDFKATISTTQLSIANNIGSSQDIAYIILKDPFG